jgi:hypothetical protein
MWDQKHVGSVPDDNTIGIFTSNLVITENFHHARLPYWLIRPLAMCHRENILRVVEPLDAAEWMELEVVEGFLPIRGGSSLQQRIKALHAEPVCYPDTRICSLAIPRGQFPSASLS